MPITSLFSGSYCNENEVASKLVEQTGYRLVRDKDVIAAASARSGMSAAKVHKAFSGKASVFNTFTHEKERSLAYLRLAMAELFLGERKGFLIMDDPLVDLDPQRQRLAAGVLSRFAERRQLLLFTCQPAHAALFEKAAVWPLELCPAPKP